MKEFCIKWEIGFKDVSKFMKSEIEGFFFYIVGPGKSFVEIDSKVSDN